MQYFKIESDDGVVGIIAHEYAIISTRVKGITEAEYDTFKAFGIKEFNPAELSELLDADLKPLGESLDLIFMRP